MTRVAAIHFGKSDNVDDNVERLIALNHQAAELGAEVIVNPELPTIPLNSAKAPIPCPKFPHLPNEDSEEAEFARREARKLATGHCANLVDRLHQGIARPYQVTVVVAVFTHDADTNEVFNSAIVVEAAGITGQYDKRVRPAESHYIAEGRTSYAPVDGPLRIGAAVCADYCKWRELDVLAELASNGCRLIAVPGSLDYPTSESLVNHKLDAAVVFANSFEHSYCHHQPPQSCIVDAAGQVLSEFSEQRDEVLVATWNT